VIGGLARRLLRRTLRLAFQARWLALVMVVLVLAGGLTLASQLSGQMPALPLPGGREPSSTENYLKGNQTYNADLMWNSLSEEALERFRSRGGTLQDMQRQLEVARERGSRLGDISYVGGKSLPDGTSLQFYVVSTQGPTNRADVEFVTYIFTLDRNGKISKVQ
jgi:hypothetical protein